MGKKGKRYVVADVLFDALIVAVLLLSVGFVAVSLVLLLVWFDVAALPVSVALLVLFACWLASDFVLLDVFGMPVDFGDEER